MRQDTGDTTLPAMGAGTRAPTGLAAEMTSFVGRTAELQRLGELLASSRLVTVTGAGGSGKTRLALRLAAASAEAFRQGVLVVELAPLTDAAAIPPAILQALGVGDLAGESTDDGVVAALRDADVLLLLDNCEHVVEACATLVTRVLADVPTARILATSREPLEAPGEATFPLAPLRLPPSDVPLVAKQIAGYESIQLFVDRATAAQPAFVLDDSNATAVADVCRRLDGLPLALELAAARTRSMSVTDILTHLDDRFALLRRSRANWPSRQQTLRATLDWSHDMLDGDERVLFRRLAVFAGGWCLDDVIDIVGDDPISADDLVALHGRLVDRSLVVAEALLGGTTRYRLLETMREYAHARLVDAGEVEAVRRRHLARFIRVAQEYDAERTSHGSDAGLGILAMHRDNLRGALEWAKATDPEAALLLTGLLDDFWRMIGAAEGWSQLQQTLAAADENSPHRLRALLTAGMLAAYIPAYAEGSGLLREADAIAQRRGDRHGAAWAQLWLGRLAFFSGDAPRAEEHLVRAVTEHEALASALGLVRSLSLLGLLRALIFGRRADGVPKLERAAAIARDTHDSWGEGYAEMMLGLCAAEVGDLVSARTSCRIALATSSLGPLLGVPLLAMAEATVQSDPERAGRLLGTSDGHFERSRTVTPPFLRERHDIVQRRVVEVIGVDAAARASEEGRRMSTAEASAYALAEGAARAPTAPSISKREALVARLVARGRTNREIAQTLHVSVRTVESHVNHMLAKLGLRNRTEVAAWANANLTDRDP